MDSENFLKVGTIVGTRGLLGEMKVKHFCDSADVFCDIANLFFDPNGLSSLVLLNKRIFKDFVLIKLDGVSDVETAKKLVGRNLFSHKDCIPINENSYFVSDIISMDVIDINSGKNYGKVCDVVQNGAHDVYCIKNSSTSKTYLLPAVKEMIKSINLNKNIILVQPIKGIFDD